MAKIGISEKARTTGFSLMKEGRQILKVTHVEVKPRRNPKYVHVTCINEEGETIKNRWDITNEKQEPMFYLFYNLGCGLELEDGFADTDAMRGCFIDITIKHVTLDGDTVVDEETGEETERPSRTFANFGYIHGSAVDFESNIPDVRAVEEEDDDIDFG